MAVNEAYTPTRLQADGLITSFAADFPVIETSHLVVQVLLRADDSVVKVAVEGVDYTVVIDQSTRKPTVTFVPASVPLATQDVFLTRAVPLTQESDIPTNNLFREPVVEDAIDKLTMISQQNDEAIGRAILLPQTWIGGQISVPLPEAGKVLKWNATEDGLENSTVDIEDIDSAVEGAQAAQTAAEAAQTAAEAAQAAAEAAQAAAEAAAASVPSLATILAAVFPVGSIYSNGTDSRNPNTIFGFGTWVAIEARTIFGYKAGDADFGTAGATGGAKTISVDAHSHGLGNDGTVNGYNLASGGTTHKLPYYGGTVVSAPGGAITDKSVLNPYVVAYVWKRTA